MTARPEENHKHNKSENWVKETVDRLLNTNNEQGGKDTYTVSENFTTSTETLAKPCRWTERSTNITTYHFIEDFKVWDEKISTSPSG